MTYATLSRVCAALLTGATLQTPTAQVGPHAGGFRVLVRGRPVAVLETWRVTSIDCEEDRTGWSSSDVVVARVSSNAFDCARRFVLETGELDAMLALARVRLTERKAS